VGPLIDAGIRGAWGQLELELRPFIAGRVRRTSDVDDVLQDVFLRMQRSLPDLRDEERFGPWVYQVARSAIAQFQRHATRHPIASGAAQNELRESVIEDDSDTDGVSAALAEHLAPFVAALPSPYREALTLTELEGLTQKDAAAMLGLSLPAMKSRVRRGRSQLRVSLEACCRIALDVRGGVLSCEQRPDAVIPPGCCEKPCTPVRGQRGG
jgi:RNA polymerase sigma-70 factor, ECF subfamily